MFRSRSESGGGSLRRASFEFLVIVTGVLVGVVPFVLLLVFGYALSFDVRDVPLAVLERRLGPMHLLGLLPLIFVIELLTQFVRPFALTIRLFANMMAGHVVILAFISLIALIDAGLRERGIVPRVWLESGNPQVLRQMVLLGFGWSVLPAPVAESGAEPLRRRRARTAGGNRLLSPSNLMKK